MPSPTSRNCLIPASAARYLTTRRRKARAEAGAAAIDGADSTRTVAALRSAAKLSCPPYRKSKARAALGTVTSINPDAIR